MLETEYPKPFGHLERVNKERIVKGCISQNWLEVLEEQRRNVGKNEEATDLLRWL